MLEFSVSCGELELILVKFTCTCSDFNPRRRAQTMNILYSVESSLRNYLKNKIGFRTNVSKNVYIRLYKHSVFESVYAKNNKINNFADIVYN